MVSIEDIMMMLLMTTVVMMMLMTITVMMLMMTSPTTTVILELTVVHAYSMTAHVISSLTSHPSLKTSSHSRIIPVMSRTNPHVA